MKLENLESVVLPREGRYKFVVVDVTDGEDCRQVLVGNPNCEYHAEVVRSYNNNLSEGMEVGGVYGGGRISVGSENIHAFGYSEAYGRAPQYIVQELLNKYVEDNGKNVEVNMGSGY